MGPIFPNLSVLPIESWLEMRAQAVQSCPQSKGIKHHCQQLTRLFFSASKCTERRSDQIYGTRHDIYNWLERNVRSLCMNVCITRQDGKNSLVAYMGLGQLTRTFSLTHTRSSRSGDRFATPIVWRGANESTICACPWMVLLAARHRHRHVYSGHTHRKTRAR